MLRRDDNKCCSFSLLVDEDSSVVVFIAVNVSVAKNQMQDLSLPVLLFCALVCV